MNDEQGEKIDAIVDANGARAKEINMAILKRWMHGEGKQPVTWRTLVQVLKDLNCAVAGFITGIIIRLLICTTEIYRSMLLWRNVLPDPSLRNLCCSLLACIQSVY